MPSRKQQARSVSDGLFSQMLSAAVVTPVAIGLTTVGAIVTAAHWLLTAVTDRLPDLPTRPRHNVQRVREQLLAARRQAEASGVLWPKVPDRTGRNC
jgi:hypothetical protein